VSIAADPGVGVAGSEGTADRPLLSLRGITKNFGAVQALSGVDLDIMPGKITALVGDNGAGKSTTIKTISGIWAPTAGEMLWNGESVTLRTPRDADALGIATVYQDLALCDNLDIVQNMFLGHELLTHRLLDETEMEKVANRTLADLAVTTVSSVRQLVGSLSGGQRQSVAVARAVMRDAQLVIMDEPTAALGVSQTAQVLDLIKRLGERGIAVLVISHNLTDVFAVADRLAVLYLGGLVSQGPIGDYDTQRAVELVTTGKSSASPGSASGASSAPSTATATATATARAPDPASGSGSDGSADAVQEG
jgi:ABC-type sugar transport system ATPase subunit